MRTAHSGAGPGFGSERAVSLLIAHTVSLGHLGAVGLAVLVIRMLLTGGTPQTFIHFILVICHRWVVAAQRLVQVALGDTSWPRAPICWDDGAAVSLSYYLSGLYDWEGYRRERRVETSFLLQGHRADTLIHFIIIRSACRG